MIEELTTAELEAHLALLTTATFELEARLAEEPPPEAPASAVVEWCFAGLDTLARQADRGVPVRIEPRLVRLMRRERPAIERRLRLRRCTRPRLRSASRPRARRRVRATRRAPPRAAKAQPPLPALAVVALASVVVLALLARWFR